MKTASELNLLKFLAGQFDPYAGVETREGAEGLVLALEFSSDSDRRYFEEQARYDGWDLSNGETINELTHYTVS